MKCRVTTRRLPINGWVSVWVIVIGIVAIPSVFVVVAASAGSFDHDVAIAATVVISTVAVIVSRSGDHFRSAATRESGYGIAWFVPFLGDHTTMVRSGARDETEASRDANCEKNGIFHLN